MTKPFGTGRRWGPGNEEALVRLASLRTIRSKTARPVLMWLYSAGHTETRTAHRRRGVCDAAAHGAQVSRRLAGTGPPPGGPSAQPLAPTARARGITANPCHTWSGPDQRAARPEPQGHAAQLDAALQRLRTATAR